jgi:hypothetical protein
MPVTFFILLLLFVVNDLKVKPRKKVAVSAKAINIAFFIVIKFVPNPTIDQQFIYYVQTI